jgi:hypothetical protein
MLSQYAADTLIVEQRLLAAPASTMSIPAAADQEDFVSMGMITAIENRQIVQNAEAVVGIELSWPPPRRSTSATSTPARACRSRARSSDGTSTTSTSTVRCTRT